MKRLNSEGRYIDPESIRGMIIACINSSRIYSEYAVQQKDREPLHSAYGRLLEAEDRITQYVRDIGSKTEQQAFSITLLRFRVEEARQEVEALDARLFSKSEAVA